MVTFFLTGLVVFLTHTLEVITGFGCTVLAFPFVTWILGIYEAKILLSILTWVLGSYLVLTKFKHINWKQFGIIVALAGVGMPVGIYSFNNFSSETLKLFLGIFIVITSVMQLRKEYGKSNGNIVVPGWVYYILLLLGGVLHGAFATGGPFVVLYATRNLRDKGEFRATLSLLWVSLNTLLIATDATFAPILSNTKEVILGGAAMGESLLNLVWSLPFLGVGIFIGEKVHHRVDADLFRKIVFWVLLATGIFIIGANILNIA